MKQLKKILIITIICSIFITGCNNSSNEIESIENIGKIQNTTTSTKEIPAFTITIQGNIEGTITEQDVNDLKLYDFELDVRSYDLDSNSKIYHEKWTGIKLKDILAKKGITEFTTIDFYSIEKINVRYTQEEITDELYLVFYHNDIVLSETEKTPVMLIATNLKRRFSVPALNNINIL